MMKAVVISAYGGPEKLILVDREIPQPKEDELLIEVKAAGVNRPDVFQRLGKYPPPAGAPVDVPGLEVSGIIQQVGKNVSNFQQGDEVMALVVGGGYAEYVIANFRTCLPKPTNISFEQAASLPETIFTVWHNVFQRGRLISGENILIHGGTGGIGYTAIQFASLMGANVYTTVSTPEKKSFAESIGAIQAVVYKQEDFSVVLKEIGMDVVLDSIGGQYFSKNIEIMNPEGRIVYINAMEGAKVEVNLFEVMRKRIIITGSTLRSRDDNFKGALALEILENIIPIIRSGKFQIVISDVFPLSKASDAHTLMEQGDFKGKIILQI